MKLVGLAVRFLKRALATEERALGLYRSSFIAAYDTGHSVPSGKTRARGRVNENEQTNERGTIAKRVLWRVVGTSKQGHLSKGSQEKIGMSGKQVSSSRATALLGRSAKGNGSQKRSSQRRGHYSSSPPGHGEKFEDFLFRLAMHLLSLGKLESISASRNLLGTEETSTISV